MRDYLIILGTLLATSVFIFALLVTSNALIADSWQEKVRPLISHGLILREKAIMEMHEEIIKHRMECEK